MLSKGAFERKKRSVTVIKYLNEDSNTPLTPSQIRLKSQDVSSA
jgi:hypothetical protein